MKSFLTFKYTKIIAATVLLVLSFLIFFITYQRTQQSTQSLAWDTDQSAESICKETGTVAIRVSFTNKEKSSQDTMLVTVLDNQSGNSIDLGSVPPGETASGMIDTGLSTVTANTVQFKLKWANRSGTDARTSSYQAIQQCQTTVTPTPSATPTGEPSSTPTVEPTPTEGVTESPTPTETGTPSVTPTEEPSTTPTEEPSTTPTNSPTPSVTPTGTITPGPSASPTRQPTYTPYPTYTPNPSHTAAPTPTEIIIVVNNTNTPTPTGQQEAQPTIPTAGVPVSWFIVIIPFVLLTLGLIL